MKSRPHSKPNNTNETTKKAKETFADISEIADLKIKYSHHDSHWLIINRHTQQILATGQQRQIADILDRIEFQTQTDQKSTPIKTVLRQLYKKFLMSFKRNN
tara:strand:+ start:3707 stop:4012 length:306 start_codon:yes stop_codon:yes gene_type:complete